MSGRDKPLRWGVATPRTPPWGREARIEAGVLLRRLQQGESLGLPHARPMPSLGRRVAELRVPDGQTGRSWRIVYRVDREAILIVHWFPKSTRSTPRRVLELCRQRLAAYGGGRDHHG
jgi:phage-related protein